MLMKGVQKGQVYKCKEAERRGFVRTLTVVQRSENPSRWWVDSYNSITKQTRRITVREDRILSSDYDLVVQAHPVGQLELTLDSATQQGSWSLGFCADSKKYSASANGGPLVSGETPLEAMKSAVAIEAGTKAAQEVPA